MVETYQQAIQWAVRAIGRDNAFPALSDWEWWKELARDKTVWGRLAKKAYKRYVAFHLRQDQVESWHGAIFTACLKHTDQQHPQVLKKEFHVCILCSKAFSTPQGWFLHAHGKHGYRSREGQAAQGTYCFCCDKQYRSQESLRMHLRYSAGCCAFFDSLRQEGVQLHETTRPRHEQMPWYRQGMQQQPQGRPETDKDVLMVQLQNTLVDFWIPEDDAQFTLQLTEHLKQQCAVLMPFQTVFETFAEWALPWCHSDNSKMCTAIWAVQDWLLEMTPEHDPSEECPKGEELKKQVKVLPWISQPGQMVPKELFVLHLFSGRRRQGDLQTAIEKITPPAGCVICFVC